jgi:peroxiredoxin
LPSAIEQVHREFGARGLVVLAIDMEEPAETVTAWGRRHGVTMPLLLDRDGAVARRYQVTGTPTVYVVGRDGQLLGRAVGTKPWASASGRALVEALLRS